MIIFDRNVIENMAYSSNNVCFIASWACLSHVWCEVSSLHLPLAKQTFTLDMKNKKNFEDAFFNFSCQLKETFFSFSKNSQSRYKVSNHRAQQIEP